MFRFYVIGLCLILHITMLTGILVKGKVDQNVKFPTLVQSALALKESKFYVKNISENLSNLNNANVKNENSRNSTTLSSKSPRNIIGTASNNLEWHTPLFTQIYTSHLKNTVKPIYEADDESNVSAKNLNAPGYFYKPPTSEKTQTFKEGPITKILHPPQDLTTAVVTLDRFLKPALNADSYNTPLHPPINPILGLILSRYGKYLSGSPHSGLYAYMAVNNIHNHKPFGQYKYEYGEDIGYKR